jgi:hypothetical protein
MVTKSSDKSTRMRVLGFAKAVANLEMENDGSMKTAFAATQHSDNKPTKRVRWQSRPIQYLHRRRTLPEFPHVALWREVSIIKVALACIEALGAQCLARGFGLMFPRYLLPAEVKRRIWMERLLTPGSS